MVIISGRAASTHRTVTNSASRIFPNVANNSSAQLVIESKILDVGIIWVNTNYFANNDATIKKQNNMQMMWITAAL